MDPQPSIELLEATHQFPGTYQIRVIGAAEGDFADRVVAATRELLTGPSELETSMRSTPGGRHVALTLDICVQNARQVLAIYAEIQKVPGLRLLL